MSAFVVTPSTINAIVTFAVKRGMYVSLLPGTVHADRAVSIAIYKPQQIAEVLWSENHRSVNARYRKTTPTPPISFAKTTFGLVTPTLKRALNPLDIIALCKCLAYQSCETDDWSETWSAQFLLEVIALAAGDLIDGKDVPWGLYG